MEKYDVEKKIGEGGFGEVYKVMNLNGDTLALKVIPIRNTYHLQEAQKEVNLLKRIEPCVPSLICYKNSFAKDNKLYIEMEYIEGISLHVFAKQNRGSSNFSKNLIAIIGDLVPGLKYLNSKDMIHRDIKPDNIMIEKNKQQPKLIDIGLGCIIGYHLQCKEIGPGKTNKNCCIGKTGTPFFMAPETLLDGFAIPESDIWSLGASIYEAATTNRIFDPLTPTIEELIREVREYPVNLAKTKNEKLDKLLSIMIVKDYNKRASLDEILRVVKE